MLSMISLVVTYFAFRPLRTLHALRTAGLWRMLALYIVIPILQLRFSPIRATGIAIGWLQHFLIISGHGYG